MMDLVPLALLLWGQEGDLLALHSGPAHTGTDVHEVQLFDVPLTKPHVSRSTPLPKRPQLNNFTCLNCAKLLHGTVWLPDQLTDADGD